MSTRHGRTMSRWVGGFLALCALALAASCATAPATPEVKRLQAQAVNRLHPYDPEFLGTDPSEPLRLGIVAGNIVAGPLHKPQPIEPLLAELDLADDLQWYTVRVWLDAGFTPRFTFRNGLMDVRNLWGQLVKKYRDQLGDHWAPAPLLEQLVAEGKHLYEN